MLRQALTDLQSELPNTITVNIQPADEQFALETIARQRNPENPDSAARKIAAGLAWERALITLAHHLATKHEQLQVLAERWKPPEARIDLDLILADDTKGTVWIIDAKNATPTKARLAATGSPGRLPRFRRQVPHHSRILLGAGSRAHDQGHRPQRKYPGDPRVTPVAPQYRSEGAEHRLPSGARRSSPRRTVWGAC
jgi:hypothetical protein